MRWSCTLCRALQSATHSYRSNGSDCETLTLLGMKGVNQGVWWCCAEALTCWQLWIRFTSSPKLASPKLNKAVLLCNSFFMSAANSSYCWPKVLSQSPGNFYWIALIILIKMCGGESFCQFQTESVFWRNKWNNFVAFKIPLCHASACTSLGEFKIALALSTVKGSLQCVCNTLLQVTQRIAFFPPMGQEQLYQFWNFGADPSA